MQYYESILEEKNMMLQKAAEIIEGLKRDFQSLLLQYEKCKNEKEQFINQYADWDQIQQIEQLKKILTQQVITFHHEQFKTPFTNFNYKNELEISLQRESKLKEFMNFTQQQIQYLIDSYSKCIDQPIFEGIQQILFEFEKWQNNQEQQNQFYQKITDQQVCIYSQQINEYKRFTQLYENLFNNIQSDDINTHIQNFIQNQEQLQQQVIDNSQYIQKLIQQSKENKIEIQNLRKELEDKKQQLQIQQEINLNINNEKQDLITQNQQLGIQQKKNQEQILEYLQMIDEYEKIYSEKVDIEEFNKVTQLFEQSLQDLEILQNKYEKKEIQLIDLKKKNQVQENKFNMTLQDIKINLKKINTSNFINKDIVQNILMMCERTNEKVHNNIKNDQLIKQLTKHMRDQQINNQQISIKKNHSKSFIN